VNVVGASNENCRRFVPRFSFCPVVVCAADACSDFVSPGNGETNVSDSNVTTTGFPFNGESLAPIPSDFVIACDRETEPAQNWATERRARIIVSPDGFPELKRADRLASRQCPGKHLGYVKNTLAATTYRLEKRRAFIGVQTLWYS